MAPSYIVKSNVGACLLHSQNFCVRSLVMKQSALFLAEVEAFLRRSGMSVTSFGRQAVADPNFVPDLRNGRSPSLAVVDKVHDFIREKQSIKA
jgi:hypothetical protein